MPNVDMTGVIEASHVKAPVAIPEGSRNWDLYRYACSLQARGVDDDAMLERCMDIAVTMEPPLSRGEVLSILRSAQGHPKGQDAAGMGRRRKQTGSMPPIYKLNLRGRPDLLPDWSGVHPIAMARAWIKALFTPDEVVCLAWDLTKGYRDGHGGEVYACAGQLADPKDPLLYQLITNCGTNGLWGVVNPVDGSGKRRKENVTRFNNMLVECDELDADAQLERICALLMGSRGIQTLALTWSGGKSWHAVVHVKAKNADEYAIMREWVYKHCEVNGLPIDKHCGNPTRFTRVPGAMRGDVLQRMAHVLRPKRCWDGGPADWADRVRPDG